LKTEKDPLTMAKWEKKFERDPKTKGFLDQVSLTLFETH